MYISNAQAGDQREKYYGDSSLYFDLGLPVRHKSDCLEDAIPEKQGPINAGMMKIKEVGTCFV